METMGKIKKLLLLCALSAPSALFAQNTISSSVIKTLSSQTAAFTIQQAPNQTRAVSFSSVFVSCFTTTICNFDIEINGSLASGSLNPVTAVNPLVNYVPQTQAFDNSPSTAGSIIGQYVLGNSGYASIDLSKVYWGGTPKNYNLTIRFPSTSGTVAVVALWSEQ